MVKILCLFVIFTIVKYGKFVLKMSFLTSDLFTCDHQLTREMFHARDWPIKVQFAEIGE